MEFLATQQVVVVRRMTKEHFKREMIQHAITGLIKPEEENTFSKINRKRHTDGGHMTIELPSLNMALVEVHQEMAQVRLGARIWLPRISKQENGGGVQKIDTRVARKSGRPLDAITKCHTYSPRRRIVHMTWRRFMSPNE